jgi:hypothetical protein
VLSLETHTLEPMYLVRHAMVVIDPSVPSNEWVLSDEGRATAARIALPELPVRTSNEPKAVETAVAAGWTATVDSRLREVERPWIEDHYCAVGRALPRRRGARRLGTARGGARAAAGRA